MSLWISKCCGTKIMACVFGVICIVLMVIQSQRYIPNKVVLAQIDPINDDSLSSKENNDTKVVDVIYDQKILAKEIRKIHDLYYNIPDVDKCVKRRPQCIIIGSSKCGTAELLDFMALHPKIVIRPQLETMFNPLDSQSVEGLIHKMPCSFHDQITAFKNAAFFYRMEPKALYKYNKTLKMIVLVREPVSRVVASEQWHYFEEQKISAGVKQNVTAMPSIDYKLINPKTGDVRIYNRIVQSLYDEHLEKYLQYFTWDNLLIIESKELINKPWQVLYKVETFLGLEHLIGQQHFVYNEEKGFYCIKSLKGKMICYGMNRGRTEFKEIRNETRAKLRDFFRPHNENFFKQIGTRYGW